jgi:hypothetical protein
VGQNHLFFTVPGAQAFLRDLPHAALHLIDGNHFLLEEHSELVVGKISGFLGKGRGGQMTASALCPTPGSELQPAHRTLAVSRAILYVTLVVTFGASDVSSTKSQHHLAT